MKRSLLLLMAMAIILSLWLAPDSCKALEMEFAPETIAQWIEEGQNMPDENALAEATTHFVQFERTTDYFAAIVTTRGRIMYEAWLAKQRSIGLSKHVIKSIINYPCFTITVFMFGDSFLELSPETSVRVYQDYIFIGPYNYNMPMFPEKNILNSHKYMKRIAAQFYYRDIDCQKKFKILFTIDLNDYREDKYWTDYIDLTQIQ